MLIKNINPLCTSLFSIVKCIDKIYRYWDMVIYGKNGWTDSLNKTFITTLDCQLSSNKKLVLTL